MTKKGKKHSHIFKTTKLLCFFSFRLKNMKYVLVSGGVVSGLGKGITASSLGLLLKQAGYRVTAVKIDPYLNLDAGTMSPHEHGECYVLNDGGEVDLDLGNYERFLDIALTKNHNMTTGKLYSNVIEAERNGQYLGKTVQVVPHLTDAFQAWLEHMSKVPVFLDNMKAEPEITVIELGGTVGDIESQVFLEALRIFRIRHPGDLYHVHVSMVSSVNGEPKTKPLQHSLRKLFSAGLPPDIVACRCVDMLDDNLKHKIASACGLNEIESVLSLPTVSHVYRVPRMLMDQSAHRRILDKFNLSCPAKLDMEPWHLMENYGHIRGPRVKLAIVGKYMGQKDAYLSIVKAVHHASVSVRAQVDILFVDSEDKDMESKLMQCQGVIVPGGFGHRGIQGKLRAIRWARTTDVPFLGICLGMQLAVVDYARDNGLEGANSTEFDQDAPFPVVVFMPEGHKSRMGGTMRLGSRETEVKPGTLAAKLYQGRFAVTGHEEKVEEEKLIIRERHRHRFEINPEFRDFLEEKGLVFSGVNVKTVSVEEFMTQDPDDWMNCEKDRMEIVELPTTKHPFFLGTQYHPEYMSRPMRPSPVFEGLLQAMLTK